MNSDSPCVDFKIYITKNLVFVLSEMDFEEYIFLKSRPSADRLTLLPVLLSILFLSTESTYLEGKTRSSDGNI